MMVVKAFLSGLAFSGFLLLAWSLCRASADADELMERIDEKTSILDLLVEDEQMGDKLEKPFWDAAVKGMAAKVDAEIMGDKSC